MSLTLQCTRPAPSAGLPWRCHAPAGMFFLFLYRDLALRPCDSHTAIPSSKLVRLKASNLAYVIPEFPERSILSRLPINMPWSNSVATSVAPRNGHLVHDTHDIHNDNQARRRSAMALGIFSTVGWQWGLAQPQNEIRIVPMPAGGLPVVRTSGMVTEVEEHESHPPPPGCAGLREFPAAPPA
jgi:hypothetical protein